jgi:hypothetical protein
MPDNRRLRTSPSALPSGIKLRYVAKRFFTRVKEPSSPTRVFRVRVTENRCQSW